MTFSTVYSLRPRAISDGDIVSGSAFDREELIVMSRWAGLPEELIISGAAEIVVAYREAWAREQSHLPVDAAVREVVDSQLKIVPLAQA